MLDTVKDYYNDIFENKGDPRVEDLYLMGSYLPTFLISSLYLYIILHVGPRFMKDRKPYNLQTVIMIYNILQVYLSGYILYESLAIGWLSKYSIFQCNSVDFSENPHSRREIMVQYIYFLSKFSEFFDTFFFILRKKNSQVSFLHVYHHVSMPTYMWLAAKFYPGGSMTFIACINTFIHVIMYFYYLLAGLGPHMQKYLWWKKYLTVLQLIQFCLGTFHYIVVFYNSGPKCNIPRRFAMMYIMMGVVFYILFQNFYKTVYKKKTNTDGTANTGEYSRIGEAKQHNVEVNTNKKAV